MTRLAGVLRRAGADRFMRDAALSGLKDQELGVLRELTQDQTWAASKEARPVLDDLADCLLRTDAAARADLVEFVASLASDDHTRPPDTLLSRIRVAQRLDSDKPRPISPLAPRPARWAGAMGERFNSLASRMGESEVYFDWPDRPPVRRVHGTRPADHPRARAVRARAHRVLPDVRLLPPGDGRGSSGLAPTIVASPIAEGDAQRFASVLIHGLEGTWRIGDLTYEAAMPPSPSRATTTSRR